MTTEPTDAELQQLWQNSNPTNFEAISFARAVLAKWGQPSGAGEAVYQFRRAHCSDWYDGLADHGDGGGPYEERTLYTAGAVPLTDEQIKAMDRRHPAEDLCGWSYRMGVADAERHHGIKGGQHER